MKYKTINGFTKQCMKETILKHNNGTKASTPATCVYRAPNGNKCAVGCFLPDGAEAFSFEGGVEPMLRHHSDMEPYMPLMLDGLQKMQEAHDQANFDTNIHEVLCNWIEENVYE